MAYLLLVSHPPSLSILNVISYNARQVHHFNPGGGVPAWLINRLAEGKPMAFVKRLEKVAAQWDGQSKTTKGVLSDVGGFGEHGIGLLAFSPADPCVATLRGCCGTCIVVVL